ncbi:MAG: hypothetical protein CM1200mP16_05820 [Nitrospina sp.]|nr:MAG: hypothetical protein CM1200mP16_05820 [Nitrospina sp.]
MVLPTLLDSNPNSLLANEVKFNMAICNFEFGGKFAAAEKLFNKIISQPKLIKNKNGRRCITFPN